MSIDLAVRQVVREAVREMLDELRATGQLGAPPALADLSTDTKPLLLTVEDVAARCGGTSTETVRSWIHAKRLRASKPGHRYLVHPDDLRRFLDEELRGGEARRMLAAVDSPEHLGRVMGRLKRSRSR